MSSSINVSACRELVINHKRDKEGALAERIDWTVEIAGTENDKGKRKTMALKLPRTIDNPEAYIAKLPSHSLVQVRMPKEIDRSVTVNGRTYTARAGTGYYRADALCAFLGISAVTAAPVNTPADTTTDNGKAPVGAGKGKGK